jgi:hypothetical protein
LFLLILFLSCKSEITAEKLLQNSINAHGGEAIWKEMTSILYLKQTTFYDESGFIEEKKIQKIKHSWEPFETSIEWEDEGDIYFAYSNNNKVNYYINNILQNDSIQLKKIDELLKSAFYVFWQPYNLLDYQTNLIYLGTENLLDSLSVHVLKASYSNEEKGDIWHYYFNTDDFKLQAAKVKHNEKESLILNETVELETGLFLNKTRKSYYLDSLGKIKYLRAAYSYEINSYKRD